MNFKLKILIERIRKKKKKINKYQIYLLKQYIFYFFNYNDNKKKVLHFF